MSLKKKLTSAMHDYVEKNVLPHAYEAHKFLVAKGKSATYEEYLDIVLSFMKGKKEDESC